MAVHSSLYIILVMCILCRYARPVEHKYTKIIKHNKNSVEHTYFKDLIIFVRCCHKTNKQF